MQNQQAPQPLRQPTQNKNRSQSRLSRYIIATAAAGLITIFSLFSLHQSPQTDQLSQVQQQELLTDFQTIQSFHLDKVPPAKIATAIAAMGLSQQDTKALKTTIADSGKKVQTTKETALVWLDIWDFANQDGDIVSISSAGYQVTYPLYKNKTRVPIPVVSGQPIQITGTVDGGGGITLGVQNAQQEVALPVIQSGQTLTLPVTL